MRASRSSLPGASLAGLALVAALAASEAPAQATGASPPPPEQRAGAPAAAPPERPEYRARSLPSDTFEPSEQVSEDHPVPFPEDI